MPDTLTADVVYHKGREYTRQSLFEKSMADLLSMYNTAAERKKLPTVKKFESRLVAIKRVWELMVEDADGVRPEVTAQEPPAQEEQKVPVQDQEQQEGEAVLNTILQPDVPSSAPGVEEAGQPETVPASSSTERRKRQMYFNFAPNSAGVKAARPDSLRERVLKKMLDKGLTYEQVVEVVKAFDAERLGAGKDIRGSDNHPERRAYEVIRIIHYILGYGLKHDAETGIIKAYDYKKVEADKKDN